MADQKVGDKDLDLAAGAVEDEDLSAEVDPEEEDIVVEDEEEDVKVEPDDNAARSKLGRKVAKLFERADKHEQLLERMSTLLEKLATTPEPDEEEDVLPDLDEDDRLTKKDVLRLLDQVKRKETTADSKYAQTYRAAIERMGQELDPELHKVIVDEMVKSQKRYSDDGIADATRNYRDAQVVVLSGLLRQKETVFGNNEDVEDDGLGGPIKENNPPAKKSKPIKLDKYALEFARKTNMSEDDVRKALDGDAPMHLMGRR